MTSDKADRGLNPNLVHNPNPNRKSPMNLNPNPGRYFNGVSCPDHFTIHGWEDMLMREEMLKPSSSSHHFIFHSDPDYEILSKKGLFLGGGVLVWCVAKSICAWGQWLGGGGCAWPSLYIKKSSD